MRTCSNKVDGYYSSGVKFITSELPYSLQTNSVQIRIKPGSNMLEGIHEGVMGFTD